ncbi:MAG: hypothetical protein LBC03_06885 [Nitrososphaerota archaeon]|jgi:DNA sulfur modification protein DndD|nr:hypothetical protein [Nitrososphaerota archaeon]
MKVRVLEITYNNIREMNNLTINLCQDGGIKRVSLIQMRNGVGKTTTMDLLRYCLDKKASKLTTAEIRSFKPSKSAVPNGFFRVKFSIDSAIKYVTLHFDYLDGVAKYTTSTMEKGGEVDGVLLGEDIESWLSTKNFVRLFVFDGELAGELLSSKSASAEEAINALYHLDNLKNLYGDNGEIDHVVNEKISGSSDASKAQTDQGKQLLETHLENAQNMKKKLNAEVDEAKAKWGYYTNEITKIKGEIDNYRDLDTELVKKYQELTNKDVKLESDLYRFTEMLLSRMRNPVNFDGVSESLLRLSEQMMKVKLPKTQSIEFFEELAEHIECICGRPIGPAEKAAIKARAKDYLSEDNIGELNAIKTDIRHISVSEDIQAAVKLIRNTNREKMLNQRAIQKLDKQTIGKEKIEELTAKKREYEDKELEWSAHYRLLTEDRKEEQEAAGLKWDENINLCTKRIDELRNRIATATNTITFVKKAGVLKEILREINRLALIRLKENILTKTNQRIAELLDRNDIDIAKIDTYLHLSDRENVSEGQKLSIAYAFLSTLFSEAPHSLPFIVDTPAAPLDLGVRREVSKILPELFEQLVVFITSGERNGFADRFYSGKDECLFLTVSKDGSNMKVISNQEYFKNYQETEE